MPGDKTFAGIYVGDGVVVSNGVPVNFDNDGNIINYKDLSFATNGTRDLCAGLCEQILWYR